VSPNEGRGGHVPRGGQAGTYCTRHGENAHTGTGCAKQSPEGFYQGWAIAHFENERSLFILSEK